MAGIDTGDTAWMLMSTALVMLMTPGLAFFYGGLVRRKNVLSIMMQCFILIGVISLQWVLFGYSLAFGPDHGGLIGGLSWAGLNGVGLEPNPDYAATIPHQLFMVFQMMFAVITPALIIGAFAERMKFSAFLVFTLLWATLVYDPMAHWVWGVGGWLRDWARWTSPAARWCTSTPASRLWLRAGARQAGRAIPDTSPPHNLPFAILGAALLWFGWFGFNAGSALAPTAWRSPPSSSPTSRPPPRRWPGPSSNGSPASGPTVLGSVTGAVAGLVAITPASGFVTPLAAIAIGVIAGLVCYVAVVIVKAKLGYDDSLDAFGVHGVGGIVGALATGLFATRSSTRPVPTACSTGTPSSYCCSSSPSRAARPILS